MVELLVTGLFGERCSFASGKLDINDGGPNRGSKLMITQDPILFGDAYAWADHA